MNWNAFGQHDNVDGCADERIAIMAMQSLEHQRRVNLELTTYRARK